MRRISFILVLLLGIALSGVGNASFIACTKSDGGRNKFEYGELDIVFEWGSFSEKDECIDKNTLREWYCRESEPNLFSPVEGAWKSEKMNCVNGCVNGTCNEELLHIIQQIFLHIFEPTLDLWRNVFSAFLGG